MNKHIKRYLSFICIITFLLNSLHVFAGTGGVIDYENGKITDNDDGIPVFRFKVSATASSSKYRYKTIGWKMKFTPEGKTQSSVGTMPYTFESVSQDLVDIELEDIFDKTNLPDEDKMRGGVIEIDAIQIITIYGVPMGYDNKPVDPNKILGWENDTQIILDNNSNTSLGNQRVKIFTDDSSGILGGLPHGLSWSDNTKGDLTSYYDKKDVYPPLVDKASFNVDVDLEVMSSVDDHTIDMSKGEGSAQVRIHVKADIKDITSIYTEYLNNPSNIRFITITLEEQTSKKKLTKTITNLTSLSGTADFTFDYLPTDIEDGDSDLDDSVTKDYKCEVEVRYLYHYRGYGSGSTSAELIKKAPIPDGDPLAILSVPDQVLVDEEILADGSGSIAPEGATLVNYSWEVESQALPKEEGNKSITLTYDEPKTVTVALTVEDSNGKTDTVMKDVKVIKKASPPINWSPDVILSAPSIVMQGDSFSLYVNATDQEDGPLTPTLSKPSSLVLSGPVHNGDNTAKFMQSGIFTVTAKATDSGGKSDSASTQIEVCPPKPLAIISEDGDYKVGQTVVLDSSNSKAVSKTYPIDWTLTNWTITPLGSLTNDDIYTKKLNDKEIAFTSKKSGKVEIALTVTNTLGYSNTRTIERTIVTDAPPIADFTLIEKVYRDKDNEKKAIVRAFDTSSSPDGDSITKRAWFYAFDSDNNGIFSDDTWYYHNGTSWVDSGTAYNNLFTFADTVNTGNLTDVTVETTHVGRYKFELKVYEEHDNRLLEFVDTSYILTDDTADKPGEECIAEVDNIAPVTAVKVDVSKDEVYDIVVVTDYKDMDLISLQTELNLLKAEAFANNKDFNIHMVTDKIKVGQQHKIKNYYTYARNIYLSYYLDGGYMEYTGPDGYEQTNYNRDYRSHTLWYETTQAYTTPTIPFEKGDHVEWQRTSFSEYKSGSPSYDYSGVRFEFYNPDNKIATRIKEDIITSGHIQTLYWAKVFNSIGVIDENVSISNTWTMTSNSTPHDFYYDIHAMDFSKVKDVSYENGSKRIFLFFTKGTGLNYEYDGYNYSATNIEKDFVDYLVYNDFETYVVTSNESILGIRFDNNNYGSNINNQYASLRELAHCSPVRGKYVVGGPTTDIWKEQLLHITKNNVIMPNEVTVENNVIELKFDEPFKKDEEVHLKVLLEEFKLSDLLNNQIELPKLEYKNIKHNDTGIKSLSSFCLSDPLSETVLNEDIEVIEIIDYLTLYKEEGVTKVQITDQERAKEYFSDEEIEAIKKLDYSNVNDIQIGYYFITIQKDDHVKLYGKAVISGRTGLVFNPTQWTDVKKIYSTDHLVIGLKNNGGVIVTGYWNTGSNSSPYSYYNGRNLDFLSTYDILDAVILRHGITLIIRHKSSSEKIYYPIGNIGSTYIHKIDQTYNTNDVTLIGNSTSQRLYFEVNGKYYSLENSYSNSIYEYTELNGMSIKEFIPTEYGFIAIKQDDTLYFSNKYKSYLQGSSCLPGVSNLATTIGTVKKIIPVDSYLMIQGSNREFYTYLEKNMYETSSTNMCIPIKDVQKVISNGGNGSGYYKDDIIFVMDDGYQHYLTNNINAMLLNASTEYFFMDEYGLSYMTDTGYFYSSLTPSRESWKSHAHRKFSGHYDKVIIDYDLRSIIGLRNEQVTVYYDIYSNYSYLTGARYYSGVKDIYYKKGVLFLIRDTGITRIYKDNFYEYFTGYNQFLYKNIKKYLFAKVSPEKNDWYFYGLSENGDVWRTSPSGLVKVATNIEDIYTLNDDFVSLSKSGYLNKYGEGNSYEKYENMLIAPHFITLKLKNGEDLVYISPQGINIGYIGNFEQTMNKQHLRSTQFHIGKHQDDGVAFKYKVFTDDEQSVEEVLYQQDIDDTWIQVKDLDIIPVTDGYYIGVVEVNADNRAIGYSYMKAKASKL
ncbi:hypothetical protein HZI73_26270 (plasmid) [Vallitalea pronyensis]|uniref:PKD/Chitinase domain-containing protein n=1 Tax=Vallitalea pronyensis TaxID=1348613 RepID=A0A8J8MQH5_9FIRM|nr:hypothetical protein [Vallitalea pronyensis]QUI25921.1 hypothetical protein HZI73_26270 [Vallitalea pronyensis]